MQCRLITSRNLPRERCFPGVAFASMADGEFQATSCWRNPIRVRLSHRFRRDLFFFCSFQRDAAHRHEFHALGRRWVVRARTFQPPCPLNFREIAGRVNKIASNPQRDHPIHPADGACDTVWSIRFRQIDSANSLRAYLL